MRNRTLTPLFACCSCSVVGPQRENLKAFQRQPWSERNLGLRRNDMTPWATGPRLHPPGSWIRLNFTPSTRSEQLYAYHTS